MMGMYIQVAVFWIMTPHYLTPRRLGLSAIFHSQCLWSVYKHRKVAGCEERKPLFTVSLRL